MKNHYSLFIIHYSKYVLTVLFIMLALFVASNAHAGTIIKGPAYLGLTRGLVGCWTLDGAYTQAPDCSGSNNTGTLTGGPTKVVGKVGQALDFDGSNDYVELGTTNLPTSANGPWTLSGWVKIDLLNSQHRRIVGFGDETDGNTPHISLSNSNHFRAACHGVGSDTNDPSDLTIGRWYHVVGTFDGTTEVLYVDGISRDSEAISCTPVLGSARIGRNHTDIDHWDGSIDEVRIYNRALSANEIARLHRIGLGSTANRGSSASPLDKGLVGHWTFDANNMSATLAKDRSGNNNNGTLTGGPTKQQGKVGQALSFDGGDDYVRISDPTSGILDFGTSTNFTATTWIKRNASGSNREILSKENGGTAEGGWSVYFPSGAPDKIQVDLTANTQDTYCSIRTSANVSAVSDWHHVGVVVFRAASCTTNDVIIYIDGVLVSTSVIFSGANSNANVSNTYPLDIGSHQTTGGNIDYFPGLIDDVRIYNRALSAAEISRLYQTTQSKFNSSKTDVLTHGLINYWNFDGPNISGTRAKDTSGNQNHGTITGSLALLELGKIGQGFGFDGVTTQYITIDNSSLYTSLPDGTISFWAKPDSIPAGAGFKGATFAKNAGGNNNGDVQLGFTDTGKHRSNFDAGSGGTNLDTVNTCRSGSWCLLTYTWDNEGAQTVLRVYFNGTYDTTQTLSSTILPLGNGAQSIFLGNNVSADMNGAMDDVRIYNRALSASEVNKLYQMGR